MVFSVRDIQGYSLTQEQADLLKALGFDNADTLLEHEYHSFVGVIDGKPLSRRILETATMAMAILNTTACSMT